MTRLPAALLLVAAGPAAAADFDAAVRPFLKQHCVGCHGPEKPKGNVSLHALGGDEVKTPDGARQWSAVLDQIESGAMPPEGKPRPAAAELRRAADWIDARLATTHERQFPNKANALDHRLLFGEPADPASAAASPARFWRISPYHHRTVLDGLSGGEVLQGQREVAKLNRRHLESPLALGETHNFRDYSFRQGLGDSTLEQLALDARVTLEVMVTPRGRGDALTPAARAEGKFLFVFGGKRVPEVADLADAKEPAKAEQVEKAVRFLFGKVLVREPSADEVTRYTAYAAKCVEKFGNRDGVIRGLSAVLLHPDSLFRTELGGQADAAGRALLEPHELARAIALAVTDKAPDAELLKAAKEGKLATRADARREVERLLDDPKTDKPRLLRFFQEYFEYVNAAGVFKDDSPVALAGLAKKDYRPSELVEDTDLLVLHFIREDKRILRNLLTTNLSYVSSRYAGYWGHPMSLNDIKGCRKEDFFRIYGLADPKAWTPKGPMELPKDQRAGVLTQPSWLVAHSTNDSNNAILRGKWIRERLLGGILPDVPIGVDAALPDEPNETLRHRMRVTREESCWKCHQRMDPLGLPFERYDFVGQHRAEEVLLVPQKNKQRVTKPVDATGEVVASGDPALDGPVKSPLELVNKLAGSERVHQVFVRHAFRYFLGRNETRGDAYALQEAYKAYRASDESLRALVASLLTSDAFLYRQK